MAKQDALVAVQNALQKVDQRPDLLHNEEEKKLNSVRSKLQRYGSRLDRLEYTVTELTGVREYANDVEDVMDNAVMVSSAAKEAAQKRWRLLNNLLLFVSEPNQISKQIVKEQIKEIAERKPSIGRSTNTCGDGDGDDDDDTVVQDQQPLSQKPPNKLLYHSLSVFPEDVEISARRLIQIWMAEGFLGSSTMEEQGRDQIDLLLKEGYITEPKRGTCGNLKTFKIGKDELEKCRLAAQKENTLHVITDKDHDMDLSKLGRVSRLAIHNSTSDLFKGWDQRKFARLQVHSLHIYCDTKKTAPSDFGFLRPQKNEVGSLWVLDLGSLELETVPEVIGKLTHLRYLRLKASKGTKIPASICNLSKLQTIDLKETKSVKTLPVEIWKMKKNLRHLHLPGATALPPPRRANHYGSLENLQTLCGIRPDKELKRLMVRAKFPNVKRLRLQTKKKDSQVEFLSVLNSLDHLYHLRSLTLEGPIKDHLPLDWNAFPSSLTKMTLLETQIPADQCLKKLQNLPNLRVLKLMKESVSGTEMECDGGGFPALQVLKMAGVKKLTVGKGAMRLLRDLEVEDCPERVTVKAVQPSMELLQTLQKLHNKITIQEVTQ